MKKQNFYLSDFWYGALLIGSIWLIISAFNYADSVRGYNATGGEFVLLLLPLFIMKWKSWSRTNKRKDDRKFYEERY